MAFKQDVDDSETKKTNNGVNLAAESKNVPSDIKSGELLAVSGGNSSDVHQSSIPNLTFEPGHFQADSIFDLIFEGLFIPTEDTIIPHEGLYTAFEEAFFKYLDQDDATFENEIQLLGHQGEIQGQPNFLNLSFEDLFKIQVTEGSGDVASVSLAGQQAAVDSIGVALGVGLSDSGTQILSVTSQARDLTRPPNVQTSEIVSLPPPINGHPTPPTTPPQIIDNVDEKALDFSPSASYQGNIFQPSNYNNHALASFGPDGGSSITANFASPVQPGSSINTSIYGEIILTMPQGNYLTFYTASVNGHMVGDYVYTEIAPHLLSNTPPADVEIIGGQRYFIDTFYYGLTTNYNLSSYGLITVIIKDDKPVSSDLVPVATNQGFTVSEADIKDIGSNLHTVSDQYVSSLITSPTSPDPNYFGANGGFVSNVTIAGGTTFMTATTITVTDSIGNTLVIDRATGDYVYTLNTPFHNTNNQPALDVFQYQFTDLNGNTAHANLIITIADDSPVALNENAGTILESHIEGVGSAVVGSATPIIDVIGGILAPTAPALLNSRYGADGQATDGVTNVTLLGVNGATAITGTTSSGHITALDVANSNGILSASNIGHDAFFVTDSLGNVLIVDQQTSQYYYELNKSFHQNTPDTNATVSFSYQLTDSDGSTSTAVLNIVVTDDSPVAVNENAGTILESHIEGVGSAVVGSATPIIDTISGILVPVAPTTSTSRYGADGQAIDGVTKVTLLGVNGATAITGTTTSGLITALIVANSNGALNASNIGHAAFFVTDSLGNILIVDQQTSQYYYELNKSFHQNTPDTNATVSFSYQITDTDGSTSTAVLKVVVTDDSPVAVNENAGTILESHIEGVGSAVVGSATPIIDIISGILVPVAPTTSTSRYGADGQAIDGVTKVTLLGVNGATAITGTTTSGLITALIVANSNGALNASNIGHAAFFVTDSLGNILIVDQQTSQYYYELNKSFHQNTPDTNATVSFSYQITDTDGSTSTAVLKVVVTDDSPVAVNENAGTILESHIEGVGSAVVGSATPIIDTISGILVPVAPTTSTSRYGADGQATDGVTNVTLLGVNGATAITGTTTSGLITALIVANSNGALNASNIGHAAFFVTDSLGNILIVDQQTSQYYYELNKSFHQNTPDTNATVSFSYQITDTDGSTSTAVLKVVVTDDSPVAVNENAGTILESHIEGVGSAVVGSATPIIDTISGILVPVAPTTSTSRYGADGQAIDGVTKVTLLGVNGATAITGTTTSGSITALIVANSNGALNASNIGHAAFFVTDSLGNILIVDQQTSQYYYELNKSFHQNTPDTNATVSFSYQITDTDGSTSTAVLKVVVTDDSPVAVNENAGTILESHIEGVGSAVVGSATPIIDTISGILVPVAPTTSTSRYGADGQAIDGVTKVTLLGVNGATAITGTTTSGLITALIVANSNGALNASNIGHAAFFVTDSLGNILMVD